METQKFDIFFKKNSKFEFWLLTKSWNHLSFVNISPTLVIDTSMERSSRILHHGNPKIWYFFQKNSKFEFWLLTKSWNHLSFVNISPTLVIDTSMERSSRVLQHEKSKIWFYWEKHAHLSVSAVMFCKQFLAYAVHIDWCYHSIHKHSSRSQHAPLWRHRGCIVVPSRVDI